ncbi:hypothetical protein ES731_12410 [Psychroflexus gondwanensis]|jgi:ketosteroid isomerase-like protein|uniref:nuclear transport factor 2 family protein n=1 Tax=Psychroflexus gondwanensis TaxID=251 RepID=UPI0011BEDB9D|nr:nuclear transport factor 2 family protein [Psychroflexus gondwanensis]TXE17218.1 hypothetical protein ES731_12410 [Psychroflexus gondwanensis]
MKTVKTVAILLVLMIGQVTFAQEKSYKETVIENPTAEEDLKVVADHLEAIMTNKMGKAASLLADSYEGRGPAFEETESKTELVASWKEIHKVRTNQKNDFVSQTFRVIDGDLKGDWVSVWGTYTFTENGIKVNLPYHYTAMVANGKIVSSIIYYDRLAITEAMGYELAAKQN